MTLLSIRAAMVASIVVAIMCATGIASGIPVTVRPGFDEPIIEPPDEPPTPVTPTPTRTLPTVVGPIIDEPLVQLPEDTPTPAPTPSPSGTPAPSPPTTTQTTMATPTTTQTTTQAPAGTTAPQQVPTTVPQGPVPPTLASPQPSAAPSQANATAGVATQVSGGAGDKLYPAISASSIVWVDNDSLSVQLYNTSSGAVRAISTTSSVPFALPHQLAVAGTNAAWSGIDLRTGASTIYLYDTASGSLMKVPGDLPVVHQDPGVSPAVVVWTNRTIGSGDVWRYDIASRTTVPVATGPSFQLEPDIGGTTMAWTDNGTAGGDFDIVVAPNGASEGTVLADPGDDHRPDVSSDGQRVAWIDFADNQSAVQLYDVATNATTRITGPSARPDAVAVDGSLVVYADLRNGNHDIYLYNITTMTETPVTQDAADQMYPDISNGQIVWMGNTTGHWEIYVTSIGG